MSAVFVSPAMIVPSFVKIKELLMPGHMFLISVSVFFSASAYKSLFTIVHFLDWLRKP